MLFSKRCKYPIFLATRSFLHINLPHYGDKKVVVIANDYKHANVQSIPRVASRWRLAKKSVKCETFAFMSSGIWAIGRLAIRSQIWETFISSKYRECPTILGTTRIECKKESRRHKKSAHIIKLFNLVDGCNWWLKTCRRNYTTNFINWNYLYAQLTLCGVYYFQIKIWRVHK